jgi:tRNA1Val (adenine37-N6)-methyltransferase
MAENRSVFAFKEFQLAHGNPGLKISTEACLFGAIASNYASGHVLDIGTGCGLLACMIAQKTPESSIKAIEIHKQVAELAKKNVLNSPYSDQIEIISCDLKVYNPQQTFDFIVCNPPFFSKHLASQNESKQIAIHDDLLSPEQLVKSIKCLLHPAGKAMVLYPTLNMNLLEEYLFKNQLYINYLFHIYSKPNTTILREIAIISPIKMTKEIEEIEVKNEENEYSEKFKKLLQPYYLIFP